ncbi:MAG: hypothetical protein Kapaf2KO_13840 [Candidatus Kapaibacteriales bacterium]
MKEDTQVFSNTGDSLEDAKVLLAESGNQDSQEEQHKDADSDDVHGENTPVHEQIEADAESVEDPISQLLSELGDHHGIYIFDRHIGDLPVILYDEGFHFYSSPQSMEEEGIYAREHHHVVKVGEADSHVQDLSPTNMIFFQWLAIIIILIAAFFAKARTKKTGTDKAPKGILSLFEASWLFIGKGILEPNIPSKNAAKRLTPYFYTLFVFIFVMNLLGLVPGGHTATATISVAAALAVTAFFMINYTAIKESGIGAWFHHLLGGAPVFLAPLMIPIEIMSMFIKPFALTIRLFANMTAGHVILFALLGLIFVFQSYAVGGGVVVFSLFIYLLELLVAFLQAYIFTMLTAIFTGLAIGDHGHHEDHSTEQHAH